VDITIIQVFTFFNLTSEIDLSIHDDLVLFLTFSS